MKKIGLEYDNKFFAPVNIETYISQISYKQIKRKNANLQKST
jgi:hypothetical protein